MNKILTLKRPFIWFRRFRHRCGYGVHSPFAFDLITNVIYEKSPYYSYNEIESSNVYKQRSKAGNNTASRKVNRMLFRLVNRCQPKTIIEAGPPSVSSLYLQAGCKSGRFMNITSTEIPKADAGDKVDFLYIPYDQNTESSRKIMDYFLDITHPRSVFVIGGIRYNNRTRTLWERLTNDPRVFTTFDLYDVGIAFFDDRKIKQSYTVNF